MEDTRETIRNIKKEFRLFMNGVMSAQLRRLGMNYNIIFGISVPHLKEIAAKFPKDKELAETLWKENIRESKLLAIQLLPQEAYADVSERWIEECRYEENAAHLAQSVLCKLPDAAARALRWIERSEELFKCCGYITLLHLFRNGYAPSATEEKKYFESTASILKQKERHPSAIYAMRAIDCYCDEDGERAARYSKIAE